MISVVSTEAWAAREERFIQVKIVNLKLLQTALKCGGHILPSIFDFGGDKEHLSWNPALFNRDSDFSLGSMRICGINMHEAFV